MVSLNAALRVYASVGKFIKSLSKVFWGIAHDFAALPGSGYEGGAYANRIF
jgi:hypothetical protein